MRHRKHRVFPTHVQLGVPDGLGTDVFSRTCESSGKEESPGRESPSADNALPRFGENEHPRDVLVPSGGSRFLLGRALSLAVILSS